MVGKLVDDDDLVSYVLSGLNAFCGPFVTALSINTRNSPITFEDFQAELLSHDIFLDNYHSSIPPGNNSFAMFSNRKPFNHFSNRKSRGPMSFASKRDSRNPHCHVNLLLIHPDLPLLTNLARLLLQNPVIGLLVKYVEN